MPAIAFCALDQVYGDDWNKKKKNISQKQPTSEVTTQPHKQPKQQQYPPKNQQQSEDTKYQQAMNVYSGSENSNDLRSFCPNCKNCLNANNMVQQKIIDQTIWPRPSWIPQNPTAYETYDPYNRYWMNNYEQQAPGNNGREDFGREDFGNFGREDFGNFGRENFGNANLFSNNRSDGLLQLILFVLVALFIIQLFEMIFRMAN